jgi:hypothetical protein
VSVRDKQNWPRSHTVAGLILTVFNIRISLSELGGQLLCLFVQYKCASTDVTVNIDLSGVLLTL